MKECQCVKKATLKKSAAVNDRLSQNCGLMTQGCPEDNFKALQLKQLLILP